MPRTESQKLKTLYIAKYIMSYSDENHDFSATDIIQYLEDEHGITAERRSVYRDLEALRDVFGFDIESTRGGRYRLLSRQFEFDDLRLWSECVDAAKFISAEKAKELVETLSDLCSVYQREQLISETFVCNRAKTTQKGVLLTITKIRAAMSTRRDGQPHTPSKITFKYLKHSLNDLDKQIERRKGELYKVSPYKLLINDGNYYLLAFCDKAEDLHTYRIDRMKEVTEIEERREGEEAFAVVDLEHYTNQVFSMYGGKIERVTIRFLFTLLDTMVERFGTDRDVYYDKEDDTFYTVSAHVAISNTFYGWLCGFGKRVKLVYPPKAVEGFKAYLDKLESMYQ